MLWKPSFDPPPGRIPYADMVKMLLQLNQAPAPQQQQQQQQQQQPHLPLMQASRIPYYTPLEAEAQSSPLLSAPITRRAVSPIPDRNSTAIPTRQMFEVPNVKPTAASKSKQFTLFDGGIVVDLERSVQPPKKPRTSTSTSNALSERAHLGSPSPVGSDAASLKRKPPARSLPSPPVPLPSPGNTSKTAQNPLQGLERFCRNVASSEESMSAFRALLQTSSACSVAVVWPDRTSNHTPTTPKLCTPSMDCKLWHCACERGSRVAQARSPLYGVMFALSTPDEPKPSIAYLLPLHQQDVNCPISVLAIEQLLFDVFADAHVTKVAFNAQMLVLALLTLRKDMRAVRVSSVADPRIAAYLCDSNLSEKELELAPLLGRHCGLVLDPLQQQSPMVACLRAVFAELCGVLQLHDVFVHRLESDDLVDLYACIEMPITDCLARMELRGVGLDEHALEGLESRLERALEDVTAEFAAQGAPGLNPMSPEQVAAVLYDELKLPAPVRTGKQKHSSTSEEDLKRISHLHPLVDLVLRYRAIVKLLSTFVKGMRQFLLSDGDKSRRRIHCLLNQTIVRTGRLSCCRPNLQTLPKALTIGSTLVNVREVVRASSVGCVLVAADYSQIEMRVFAHVTGDEGLREVFTKGGDVYIRLAAEIFNKSTNEVSGDERNRAKVVCLGVMYGMGPGAVAARLNITIQQATAIVKNFLSKYAQAQLWMEAVKQEAHTQGFVRTICGRRRYLDPSDNAFDRQAINTVIQGSASDIIKAAMLRVEEALRENYELASCALLLQLHDELVVECPNDPATIETLALTMNRCMELEVPEMLAVDSVPLLVSISVGETFGSLVKRV